MSLLHAFTVSVKLFLILVTARAVVAQDDQQCRDYVSDLPLFPGNSCEDIYNKNQRIRDQPGYYWILDHPSRVYCGMNYSGPTCEDIYVIYNETHDKPGYYRVNNNWAYCDMIAIAEAFSDDEIITSCVDMEGIWRRIASFNIDAGDNCPSPWIISLDSNIGFCGKPDTAGGCSSVIYSSSGRNYNKVCGWASGYQFGSTDGFLGFTDDFDYFEGLSITHGNPRRHIWTYAVGLTDRGPDSLSNCPCAAVGGINSSDFVGSDYYCESGVDVTWDHMYFLSDVLWDGAGCSIDTGNTCCSNPNLPWFYKELSNSTPDDIEVRICTDQPSYEERVVITNLELYIQ